MLALRAFRRLPSGPHYSVSLHRPSDSLPLSRLSPLRHTRRAYSSPVNNSSFTSQKALIMDASIKQHYLADSPPTVVRLEAKSHFESLKDVKLRKYAHYMSRFALQFPPFWPMHSLPGLPSADSL